MHRRPLSRALSGRRAPVALVLLALVLLGAGLLLPVIRFPRLLGPDETYSVVSGVRQLWREGELPLAFLVFAFSIVLPVVELSGSARVEHELGAWCFAAGNLGGTLFASLVGRRTARAAGGRGSGLPGTGFSASLGHPPPGR